MNRHMWIIGFLAALLILAPPLLAQDSEEAAKAAQVQAAAAQQPAVAVAESLGPAPEASAFSENWDGVTGGGLPTGWAWVRTAGTSTSTMWVTTNSMTYPTATAHTTPNVAKFISFSLTSGNAARLFRTTGVDLSSFGGVPVELRFYMYHDTGYPTPPYDTVQVCVSTDGGTTWTLIGPVINRYATVNGWTQHAQSLAAYTGAGFTDVRVGFVATSAFGNNIYLDEMEIHYPGPTLAYQTSAIYDDFCNFAGPGEHNHIIDPGETVQLDVTLTNTGDTSATGILGVLSTVTPGITVTTPMSGYPDIAAGGTGVNTAHFAFKVDKSVACGTGINFGLWVTATAGWSWSVPIALQVGQATVSLNENFDAMAAGPVPAPWSTELISGNAWNIYSSTTYSCSTPNFLRYQWNTSQAANSWAYTPALSLQSGVTYTLSFNEKTAGGTTFPEILGVFAGLSANHTGMTITLQPDTQITMTSCTAVSIPFTVPATGTYYIGFHAASLADEFYITVDDVKLTSTVCNPCPVCSITSCDGTAPARGVAGTSVNFDGSAVTQYCTGSETYDWTFGDTTSTSGQHVAHTYAASGTYNWGMTAGVEDQTCTDNGSIYICPVISLAPATLPGGTVGTAYSQTITASGGTGPYTYSITAGTQPTGLTLAVGGLLSGTPTAAGTFNFTVTATDAQSCTGSQAYSIQMVCPTITVNPATLPGGAVGTAYNQTIIASGGTSPCTYAITAGAQPAGLTLSSGGLLSGTPTATGTFTFTVTATDTYGCTGTRGYSIAIVYAYGTYFLDTYGRSRMCANFSTGTFIWNVLTGPDAGDTYTGTCIVTETPTTTVFTSPPGVAPKLNLAFYKVAKTASGSCVSGSVISGLVDTNTLDNPPSTCQ